MQEVLQKVVEKINTFQGDSSLYTWMYRIAVNQSLMRLRTQKGKEFVSLEEHAPEFENGIRVREIPDWSNLPEALFTKKELQDEVLVSEPLCRRIIPPPAPKRTKKQIGKSNG